MLQHIKGRNWEFRLKPHGPQAMHPVRLKRDGQVVTLAALLLLCAACGGGGGMSSVNGSGTGAVGSGPAVTVSVSPSSASLHSGGTDQFTATVSGTSNTAVSWSDSCSIANCGTVSSAGLYTAPTVTSTLSLTVAAISEADSTAKGTASVTVLPKVSISISPTTATVISGGTQQFTATVSGASNTAVNWSVQCAVSSCGTISSAGLYTAPTVTSNLPLTVVAAAAADPSTFASASVTVGGQNPVPQIVAISPVAVTPGHAGFTLTVSGTGFLSNSTVQLNGQNLNTTFDGSTGLSADISSTDVTSPGQLEITVMNSAPGGRNFEPRGPFGWQLRSSIGCRIACRYRSNSTRLFWLEG